MIRLSTIVSLAAACGCSLWLSSCEQAPTTVREPDPPVVSNLPAVTADQPVTVFADSVILRGTVNPNGLPTMYYFMYDSTVALRFGTPEKSAGSGVAPVTCQATVSGLWAGTVHQWRFFARNASGLSWVDGKEFLFRPQAPYVANCSGVSSTKGVAILTGRINPNRTATTYRFEYDTLTLYRWQTPEQSLPAGVEWKDVQAAATNLPGMVFHVRLVATNEGGTSRQEGTPFMVFGNATFRQFDFPLAVGNTWVYHYSLHDYWSQMGTHTWKIMEQTFGGWRVQVARSDSVLSPGLIFLPHIQDSLSFVITETPDTIFAPFPEWVGLSWSAAARIPRTFVNDSDTLRISSTDPNSLPAPSDRAIYCSGIGLVYYYIRGGGGINPTETQYTLLSYSLH